MGLLGMRLQHGLEGVEIGPVLGQGSFGCVYKGVTAPSPAPRSIHVATLNAIPRPSSGSLVERAVLRNGTALAWIARACVRLRCPPLPTGRPD